MVVVAESSSSAPECDCLAHRFGSAADRQMIDAVRYLVGISIKWRAVTPTSSQPRGITRCRMCLVACGVPMG
ncbi:hypothetical protein AMK33_26335 [Streptomyces sp. CB02400]|nr:hypothetical protein AMK33_26335 [Streptomyces sp. CB02400]